MAGPFNIVAQLQLQAPTNLQSVVSQIQRSLAGITATVNVQVNTGAAQVLQQLNSQLATLQGNLQSTQAQAQNTGQAVGRTGASAAQMGQQVAQANNQLASTIPSLQAVTAAAAQGATAMENFGIQAGLAARRYTAFLVAGGAIVGFVNALRQGFEEALKFDREMVRLSQISGTTAADISGLSSEITRLSTTWGVSSRELAGASIQLRQAGLSANDTKVALEALAKAALSPSFGNIQDTTEGLIATMSQFKTTAADAEKSLGAINAVSTQYAVSSQDIIDAIRRTGGAFHAAGGDLNQLIALFGAVRSTSRESAESIGSSLRTIFVRMQRTSVVEDLHRLGIELRYTREEASRMGQVNLTNQFVGPYEALRRLSGALQNIRSTDPRYSAIAEELGGYRQISKIIPLMQEFGKAQDIYNTAQQGANSTTKSAEQAQAAFLVKIGKVREEFQALIRTVTESKGFQVFLDMILQLTSGLTKLASVLTPLIPLIAAFATFKIAQGAGRLAGGFLTGLSGQSPRFAAGGVVPGIGEGDTVPAMLTPGEFVIRKQAAQAIGYGNLSKINKYAEGGIARKQKRKAYVFDLDETLIAPSVEDEAEIATLREQGQHGAAFVKGFADPGVVRRARRSNLLGFAQRAKGDRFIMTARAGSEELNAAIAELGPWNGIITVGSMDLKVPGKRKGTMRKANTAEKKQVALRDLLGQGYDQVVFMDDNTENIAAAAEVEGVKALTARRSRTGFAAGGAVPLKPGHRLGQVALIGGVGMSDANASVKLPDAPAMINKYYDSLPANLKEKMSKDRASQQEFFGELRKYSATAPVDAHVMRSDKAINDIYLSGAKEMDAELNKVGGGTPKGTFVQHQQFKESAQGFILENFLSSFDDIEATAGKSPLDFPRLTRQQRTFINNLFEPHPIKANDLDAKRTTVDKQRIIVKGMNSDLFYTKRAFDEVAAEFNQKWFPPGQTQKAAGGRVRRYQAGGSVRPEDEAEPTFPLASKDEDAPYVHLTGKEIEQIRAGTHMDELPGVLERVAPGVSKGTRGQSQKYIKKVVEPGKNKEPPALPVAKGIFNIPDQMFIISYVSAGGVGTKQISGTLGDIGASKTTAKYLRDKGVNEVAGNINVYSISESARQEFSNEFAEPISNTIASTFESKFKGRKGEAADFKLTPQQSSSIMGHLFEKYITGVFNVKTPGGSEHFDYPSGFNTEDTPALDKLLNPRGPVVGKLGDAKYSMHDRYAKGMLGKWLGHFAPKGDTPAAYAKGGKVQKPLDFTNVSTDEAFKFSSGKSEEFAAGLTQEQKDVIAEYGEEGGYAGFNRFLRRGHIEDIYTPENLKKKTGHLTSALEKGRLSHDMYVYRGVPPDYITKYAGVKTPEELQGHGWTDLGYVSTTLRRQEAENFATRLNSVVMRLLAKKGSKVGPLSQLVREEVEGENEFLFAPGAVTHINSVMKNGARYSAEGTISRFAQGGPATDTVPALLTPGEFVINKDAAQRIGYNALDHMNRTGVAKFATGGPVRMQGGGDIHAYHALNEEEKKKAIAEAQALQRELRDMYAEENLSMEEMRKRVSQRDPLSQYRTLDTPLKGHPLEEQINEASRYLPSQLPEGGSHYVLTEKDIPKHLRRNQAARAHIGTTFVYGEDTTTGDPTVTHVIPSPQALAGVASPAELILPNRSTEPVDEPARRKQPVRPPPVTAAKPPVPISLPDDTESPFVPPKIKPTNAPDKPVKMADGGTMYPSNAAGGYTVAVSELVEFAKEVGLTSGEFAKLSRQVTALYGGVTEMTQAAEQGADVYLTQSRNVGEAFTASKIPHTVPPPELPEPSQLDAFTLPSAPRRALAPSVVTGADVAKAQARYASGVSGAIAEGGGIYGTHKGGQLSLASVEEIQAKELSSLGQQLVKERKKYLQETVGITSELEAQRIAEAEATEVLTRMVTAEKMAANAAQEKASVEQGTAVIAKSEQEAAAMAKAAQQEAAMIAQAAVTGGRKGPAQPTGMDMNRMWMAQMAFSTAAMYGAQGLESSAGKPEDAIMMGDTTSYTMKKGGAGALQMAGMGMSMGMMTGNPLIAGLGAAAGAAIGFATSVKQAAEDIEEARAQKANKEAGGIYEEAAKKGERLVKEPDDEVLDARFRGNVFKQHSAWYTAPKWFAGEQGEREAFADATKEEKEMAREPTYGASNPQYVKYFESQAKALANRPGANVEDVMKKLEEQESTVLGKRFGEDTPERKRLLSKTREEVAEVTVKNTQADIAQSNIGMIVRDFESMTAALRSATSGLNGLARATELSESLYKGGVTAGTERSPGENLGELGGPNPESFLRGIHEIASPFGARGQELEKSAVAADAVSRQLIAALPEIGREGNAALNKDTPGLTVVEATKAGLKKQGVDVESKEVNTVLESVRTQVNKIGFEDVQRKIGLDASGFVKGLMHEATTPIVEHAKELAAGLQQINQAYTNASARFQQQLLELGQMADQTAKLEQEGINIRTRGRAEIEHTSGMLAFNVPLSEQQHAFRERQQRLGADIGLTGEAAYNPNALSARRRALQDEAQDLQRQKEAGKFGTGAIGEDNQAWRGATDRIKDLERQSTEAGQALENLTHITEATAGVQERLNILAKEEESRRSLAERWLTGGSRGRADIMRADQMMNVAVNNGYNLEGFSDRDRKLVIDYMHQTGNVRVGNELTSDALGKMLANVNIGTLGTPSDTLQERRGLQNELEKGANVAVQARRSDTADAARLVGRQRQTAETAIGEIGPALNMNLHNLNLSIHKLTEAMLEFRKKFGEPQEPKPPKVENKASGGSIFRPQGTDTVPAMLTPGEFVVNRDSAQANKKLLEYINKNRGAVYLAQGGLLDEDDPYSGRKLPTYAERLRHQHEEGYGGKKDDPYSGTQLPVPADALRQYNEPYGRTKALRAPIDELHDILKGNPQPPAPGRVKVDAFSGEKWDQIDAHHKIRRNPVSGLSEDIKVGNVNQGPTADELSAGVRNIAGRDIRSQEGLEHSAHDVWNSTHDIGLATRTIIATAHAAEARDFARASTAATIAAGAAKIHIGQTAPGMSDQLDWSRSAKEKINLTEANLEKSGRKIETQMSTDAFKKQFGREPTIQDRQAGRVPDFSGFFARQQLRMGAGTDNMAASGGTMPASWVTDEKGVVVGRLIPGSGGFVITDNQLQNEMTKQISKGQAVRFATPLNEILNNGKGDWMKFNKNWRIRQFAEGGVVPGDGNVDTTPALLSAGEFVISAQAAKAIGYGNLHRFNKAGYYQTGGEVNRPTESMGGRPTLTNTERTTGTNNTLGESVTRLQAAFATFSSTVTNLANVLTKLPPSIALTGNHNVNVNINGGEVFSELKGTIANMITQQVNSAINNFVGQRFGGEVPKITAAEAPKPIDVPIGQ
jgi:TP901 family phage tail tape measure protein